MNELALENLTLSESFTYHSFINQLSELKHSELVDLVIKMKLVSKYNSTSLVNSKLTNVEMNLVPLDLRSIREFKINDFNLLSTEMIMKGDIKNSLDQCNIEQLTECITQLLGELILVKRIINSFSNMS